MSGKLTRELLDQAFASIAKRGWEPPVYFVAPDRLRHGRIALAYLHGFITRAEYRRLYYIEDWLR